MTIDELPDDAMLRVVSACPALPAVAAEAMCLALTKLFAQFQHEGRCSEFAITVAGGGSFMLLAWVGSPLSGCSHDKIAKLLSLFEQRAAVALLAPPPIVMEGDGQRQFFTHSQFKAAVIEGLVARDVLMWDTMVADLGSWRAGSCRPLSEHWAYPLWQRAQALAS